jgi:predicted GNAT family acetyltransferase
MNVIGHQTAREFLARAMDSLQQAEAENNLILGISRYFEANRERTTLTPYLLTVEERGALVGTAIMTPPRHLIISRMSESALTTLADYFLLRSIPVPGVVGPKDTVRLFADYWKTRTGKASHIKMSQRIYACERVLIQLYSRGHLRPAIETDEDLAIQWAAEFCRDAGIPDEIESMTARIPNAIATRSLYMWDNDRVVSTALVQRETEHGISISMVYTPAQLRRQGYATSCVAAVTQRMLDSGKRFCCLYTDLTNPTSNSIYQKIGYEPVCDSEDLVFEKRSVNTLERNN